MRREVFLFIAFLAKVKPEFENVLVSEATDIMVLPYQLNGTGKAAFKAQGGNFLST